MSPSAYEKTVVNIPLDTNWVIFWKTLWFSEVSRARFWRAKNRALADIFRDNSCENWLARPTCSIRRRWRWPWSRSALDESRWSFRTLSWKMKNAVLFSTFLGGGRTAVSTYSPNLNTYLVVLGWCLYGRCSNLLGILMRINTQFLFVQKIKSAKEISSFDDSF